jgi:hypothetical protein
VTDYFLPPRMAWPNMLLPVSSTIPPSDNATTHEMVPFTFTSSAGRSASDGLETIPEAGVLTLGQLPQAQWRYEVSMSKLLVSEGLELDERPVPASSDNCCL